MSKRHEPSPHQELMKPCRSREYTNEQVRFITPYNCREREMRTALCKYWEMLTQDEALNDCLPKRPALTYRRAKNLRDLLVRSHHIGTTPNKLFGSKGPKWGCKPCHSCVACVNIENMTVFWKWKKTCEYTITPTITCQTKAVIYFAVCPCNLIYIGLTSRELRRRVREHVRSIQAAATAEDITLLKPIPRHFKATHNCVSSLLKVWGIDRTTQYPRGEHQETSCPERITMDL